MATATHLPGGERFERSGLGRTAQIVFGLVGAAGFFAFTVVILLQGLPLALMAALTGFFGTFLGLGSVAGLRRGNDPTVIEVSEWGVWLPDLGARPWSAFRSVRVEHSIGPAGGRTVTTYRRLGLEPIDPRAGERRPLLDRVTFEMGAAYTRFVHVLMARRGVEFAPYGVHESEVGSAAFDRLVAAVGDHVTLQQVGDVPEPTGPGAGGRVAPSPGASIGAAGLLGTAIPAAFGGFALVAVAGILSGPGWQDGDAAPFALAFVGIAVVVVGGSLLQAAWRARRAGAGLLPVAIVAIGSAAGGIVAATLLGFGPR